MGLTPGTRLGPYEIVAAIGAGGMGEVYRAKDTRLDRTVAIKVLPAALAGDPEFRQRFEREAKSPVIGVQCLRRGLMFRWGGPSYGLSAGLSATSAPGAI